MGVAKEVSPGWGCNSRVRASCSMPLAALQSMFYLLQLYCHRRVHHLGRVSVMQSARVRPHPYMCSVSLLPSLCVLFDNRFTFFYSSHAHFNSRVVTSIHLHSRLQSLPLSFTPFHSMPFSSPLSSTLFHYLLPSSTLHTLTSTPFWSLPFTCTHVLNLFHSLSLHSTLCHSPPHSLPLSSTFFYSSHAYFHSLLVTSIHLHSHRHSLHLPISGMFSSP
jgi:hypothetical protein